MLDILIAHNEHALRNICEIAPRHFFHFKISAPHTRVSRKCAVLGLVHMMSAVSTCNTSQQECVIARVHNIYYELLVIVYSEKIFIK